VSACVSSSAIQQVVMFFGVRNSRYAASWWQSSALPDGGFQIMLSWISRSPGTPASAAPNSALRSASTVAASVRSAFQTLQSWRVRSGGVVAGS